MVGHRLGGSWVAGTTNGSMPAAHEATMLFMKDPTLPGEVKLDPGVVAIAYVPTHEPLNP